VTGKTPRLTGWEIEEQFSKKAGAVDEDKQRQKEKGNL